MTLALLTNLLSGGRMAVAAGCLQGVAHAAHAAQVAFVARARAAPS